MKFALCILVILGCANAEFGPVGIKRILNIHNELRSQIALGAYDGEETFETYKPSASNMRKLKWDDSLAASAQNYSNTCPDRLSAPSRDGENVFFATSSNGQDSVDYYGDRASEIWKSEFENRGWNSTKMDDNAFNSGIKEATQMVWAETHLIGCGVSVCPKDNRFKYVVVCHYEEPGNKKDANIYEEGTTCSNCPENFGCDNNTGLCIL
ncbi:hypothetical protein L5515_006958 [Caenorhabditis briggsae]|nr:hypothetical protein L5515_006955 [Caenorhabditis briggsae]UMM33494.1 hypothetical protein L5515_006956 [Caenorhabditis briggsae]UMM33497.1 hypothetical protein L5515_006958 [Caenorhabditis briggsae]